MQEKGKLRQAHNMNQEQLADLQQQQVAGEAATTNGNLDKEYEFPEVEKDLLHVQLEIRSFDPNSGVKTSNPFVQKFYPKEFDQMESDGHFKGYSVDILHDPRRGAELKQSKINAGAASPILSAGVDKPLAEMEKAELEVKYAEMFKQPAKGMSEQDLRDAIEDKILELRGRESMGHLDTANEQTQGALNDGVRTPSEQTQATNVAMDALSDAAAAPAPAPAPAARSGSSRKSS